MRAPARLANAVATVLDDTAAHVKQSHATAWDVVFRNGTDWSAHVRLEHEWLHLDAPVHGALGAPSFWPLLVRNAHLPPGIKLAVAVGEAAAPPVRLCGEILLDDAAEPSARVRALCAAMQHLIHTWPIPLDTPRVDTTHTADETASVCRETDWPVVERDGQILVQLDVPDGFAQARVLNDTDGAITVAIAIADDGPSAEPCEALALLLLRASSSVRLVRAAADERARLEVAVPAPVSVTALSHALCALSLAYRLVAREAAALARDAALAAAYLRAWTTAATCNDTQP